MGANELETPWALPASGDGIQDNDFKAPGTYSYQCVSRAGLMSIGYYGGTILTDNAILPLFANIPFTARRTTAPSTPLPASPTR
ncbi:hypothetical protein D3C76_1398770 [compost metagenome]